MRVACHDLNDSNTTLAKSPVTMWMTLRTATQQLMMTAAATETYATQFRWRSTISAARRPQVASAVRAVVELERRTSAKTAAGNIDVMTVNGQNDNNDEDTGFTTIFPQINTAISAPGAGTAGAPQKYVFFVSDGVADESNAGCLKTMNNASFGNISPRCQSPINPALCTTLKNRGIKIAVLYTTYLPLPTNAWYTSWIAPFSSQIGANMQACASPGLYFEVSPTQGISEAMNALFQKAVAQARLTK